MTYPRRQIISYTIERDYIQIYRLLYSRPLGAGQEIVKVEDAVPAVKCWFHGCKGRWLVVLDSADNIDNHRDKSYIDLDISCPTRLGGMSLSPRGAQQPRR